MFNEGSWFAEMKGKGILSSSGPNVKVKSRLGPEIGFVMGCNFF